MDILKQTTTLILFLIILTTPVKTKLPKLKCSHIENTQTRKKCKKTQKITEKICKTHKKLELCSKKEKFKYNLLTQTSQKNKVELATTINQDLYQQKNLEKTSKTKTKSKYLIKDAWIQIKTIKPKTNTGVIYVEHNYKIKHPKTSKKCGKQFKILHTNKKIENFVENKLEGFGKTTVYETTKKQELNIKSVLKIKTKYQIDYFSYNKSKNTSKKQCVLNKSHIFKEKLEITDKQKLDPKEFKKPPTFKKGRLDGIKLVKKTIDQKNSFQNFKRKQRTIKKFKASKTFSYLIILASIIFLLRKIFKNRYLTV